MLYFFFVIFAKVHRKKTLERRIKNEKREVNSKEHPFPEWTLSRRKQAIVVLVIFIRASGMLEFLIQFVRYGSPFPCVCLLRYIVLTIIYLLFNIGVNMTSGSLSVAKRDCNFKCK